jgi:hypothetical protein
MTPDRSMPTVALFFEYTMLEGTIRSVEALQRIVSGLQRGGRRVYVFATTGPPRLPNPARGGQRG